MSKNLLIAILGVSGSGKSTLVNKLERKFGFTSVKSYTTRKPRENDPADLKKDPTTTINVGGGTEYVQVYALAVFGKWKKICKLS